MNSSVRLKVLNNSESNESDLKRTYAVDTIIYIINHLFWMHQDVLEWTWQVSILISNGLSYIRTPPTTKIGHRGKSDFHMKPYLRICLNSIG